VLVSTGFDTGNPAYSRVPHAAFDNGAAHADASKHQYSRYNWRNYFYEALRMIRATEIPVTGAIAGLLARYLDAVRGVPQYAALSQPQDFEDFYGSGCESHTTAANIKRGAE
jgi:hypothetical protein